jgi:hypothetical protein
MGFSFNGLESRVKLGSCWLWRVTVKSKLPLTVEGELEA